jgi:hypothetical protein
LEDLMRTLGIILVGSLLLASTASAASRQRPITAKLGGTNPTTVTGTWYASLSFSGGGDSAATLSFVQNGSSVSGTGAVVGGGSGSINGTVTGSTFTFSGTTVAPCAGFFNGSVVISADYRTFSGSMTGSDCYGSLNATIFGVNQSAGGGAKPDADLTGVWNGTLTVSGVTSSFTFTLVQVGNSLTGTTALSSGGGSIIGNVSGGVVTFTIYEVSPCAGTFIGGGNISFDGRDVDGGFYGSDCGGQVQGNLTAAKQ